MRIYGRAKRWSFFGIILGCILMNSSVQVFNIPILESDKIGIVIAVSCLVICIISGIKYKQAKMYIHNIIFDAIIKVEEKSYSVVKSFKKLDQTQFTNPEVFKDELVEIQRAAEQSKEVLVNMMLNDVSVLQSTWANMDHRIFWFVSQEVVPVLEAICMLNKELLEGYNKYQEDKDGIKFEQSYEASKEEYLEILNEHRGKIKEYLEQPSKFGLLVTEKDPLFSVRIMSYNIEDYI